MSGAEGAGRGRGDRAGGWARADGDGGRLSSWAALKSVRGGSRGIGGVPP